MPESLDFFIRVLFLGGILTTSIYCFVTWLSRGRDRLYLGYGLFTLSSALLVFFRRVYPFFTNGHSDPLAAIMAAIFINCLAGSGLYYFLVFLKVPPKSGFYRFFIGFYIGISGGMIAALALRFAFGQSWPFTVYYILIGIFTFLGLLYVVRVIKRKEITFRLEKRLLFYFAAILMFLIVLSVIAVITALIPFSLLIPVLYGFLLFFFFIHGSKLNADYRELSALKTDLEQKVSICAKIT